MHLLREEAQRVRDRNELVKRVAASTGRSKEETLEALQKLFAPIDHQSPTEWGSDTEETR